MDIDKYLDGYIVVGVSSGPDSMCLLDMLKKKTKDIVVCHINHNVREESKEEEEYLRKYCKDNNLIFEAMTIKEYNENNFENEARKIRYKYYEEILNKYNSKYLFLAHHGDDLIETVLMKIVRGSNIEGYAGIKEVSNMNGYSIIRPLLKYTKDDIIKYNENNNIKYYIDNSNFDTLYTRNRYRKFMLPMLKKEDKDVHLKFLEYSKNLLEYDSYINRVIDSNINNVYIDNYILIDKIKLLDIFIIKNILYRILNSIYNNESGIITKRHIDNIIKVIYSDKPNMKLDMPLNYKIIKEYNKLYFIKDSSINYKDYKIEFNDNLNINNFKFSIVDSIDNDNNYVCRINSKSVTLPLYFRNRKDGDYIILKGLNKKKKIKDIFIDSKIPKSIRDSYPLLVDSNDNIIWIPGIKKSNFCIKVDEIDKNYDIIIKCE